MGGKSGIVLAVPGLCEEIGCFSSGAGTGASLDFNWFFLGRLVLF